MDGFPLNFLMLQKPDYFWRFTKFYPKEVSGTIENSRDLEGLEAFLMVFRICQMTLDIETVHINERNSPEMFHSRLFPICPILILKRN